MTKHAHIRGLLVQQQNNICFWCGRVMAQATLEHLVPQARGGKTNLNNCVAACKKCNGKKGDKEPSEFVRLKLLEFEKFLKSSGFQKYKQIS